MKISLWIVVVATLFTAFAPESADAYYAAHMGRFTSRDMIGQRIGDFERDDAPMAMTAMIERDLPVGAVAAIDFPQSVNPGDYADGFNLYEYVHGRPVALTDPSGQAWWWPPDWWNPPPSPPTTPYKICPMPPRPHTCEGLANNLVNNLKKKFPNDGSNALKCRFLDAMLKKAKNKKQVEAILLAQNCLGCK